MTSLTVSHVYSSTGLGSSPGTGNGDCVGGILPHAVVDGIKNEFFKIQKDVTCYAIV